MNRNLYNIHILGIGFMFVFSAFCTAGFISAIVLKDFNRNGIDSKTGFYSLSIIYACLGMANWFSPAVVKRIGPEMSLFLSAMPYTGYILCMINPYKWTIFTLSACLGIGGGVLWTASGEVIAKNSPGDTKARNTGIFWSWFNMSLLLGNVFLYFYLGDTEKISDGMRYVIYLVLGVLCATGMCIYLLLSPIPEEKSAEENPPIVPYFVVLCRNICGCCCNDSQGSEEKESQSWKKILQPIADAARYCKTKQMCLLYAPIIFTGVSLNFWSSVFITVIGNVFATRSYLALGGIATGIGEIAGGFIWGRLSNKIGRHGVVTAGFLICICLYVLSFLTFPADAATTTADVTERDPIVPAMTNIYLALGLGLLLGLGDGAFNVSIYAALGTIYESNPAPAFAMFKFVQSMVGAAAFVYCGHLILPYQLVILAVTCLLGCVSFIALERMSSTLLVDDTKEDPDTKKTFLEGQTDGENNATTSA